MAKNDIQSTTSFAMMKAIYPTNTSRRKFLIQAGLATGSLASLPSSLAEKVRMPPFEISLAQWTIHRELFSGKIDHLDFAKVAAEHKIFAIEYVNQFFMNKAKNAAYLAEMKMRAEDQGVRSLLIMCDNEGSIGDPNQKKRIQTVENHRKWLDAAKSLGCHSIRVNARSTGNWNEQVHLATDGLAKLTEYAAAIDLNVLVENHGGLSSNADWLAEVMKRVNHLNCGTLPDTGNFKIKNGVSYDSYRGIRKLMKWAKGVSIKDKVWDDNGNQSLMDFERMLGLVTNAGFKGHCGIEYGGYTGLDAARRNLEKVQIN